MMDSSVFNNQHAAFLSYAYAFDGPNLYRSGPGVALGVLSKSDQQQQINANLKQFAMRIGIVIGQLTINSTPHPQGMLTSLDFATPTPGIALEVARLAVEASFAGSQPSPDIEEALWQAQQTRRSEALPLWAVQILAEARRRHIPAFRWRQGLQLGYGIRGLFVPVDELALNDGLIPLESIETRGHASGGTSQEQPIDWDRLGSVPLIAISGGNAEQRHAMAQHVLLNSSRAAEYKLILDGSFEDIRMLLATPDTSAALITLNPTMLLTCGLPFEECRACVILKPDEQQSDSYVNTETILRVVGLPLLVTKPDGMALLMLEEGQAAVLTQYAPCEIISQMEVFLSRL